MRFFTHCEGESTLHNVNPTIKMVAVFVASLVLVPVFDPWTPAILYVVGLSALFVLGRLPLRIVALAHLPFLAFAVSILWVNLFFRPSGLELFRVGPLVATDLGLRLGLSLALRTLVIGVYSIGFVLTTDPTRLVHSLVQHARLSARFAYGILAAYRFLPGFQLELATIRRAREVRQRRRRSLPQRVTQFAGYTLPLLVSAIRKGERVAIALESRGLGAHPTRTLWRPVALRGSDFVFLAAMLLVSFGVPALTIFLGLFASFEAVTIF